MQQRKPLAGVLAVALLSTTLIAPPAHAELSAEIKTALASSKFVYIASTRKDGTLSKPAEIWFLYHDGAVYVGTPPDLLARAPHQGRSPTSEDRRRQGRRPILHGYRSARQ